MANTNPIHLVISRTPEGVRTACGCVVSDDRAMTADYSFYVDCDGCKPAIKEAKEVLWLRRLEDRESRA